ncbi:MAG: TIGR03667 family PPOX class F420-dependent oxidoreductase [Chloroflexota bacterium]|nr:TIGR03667 family PPOX class F420-dependent oxidoreductase [Chloroflexia bacterium]MDQ3227916.1 TIGR03667 family PPOX class F420-dependent oxidoreductase [Chloroflexota bacterium]
MEIDTSTDFGARAAGHLAGDLVVWLITVGSDQTPQPSPVWFLWDGDTALIYSQPGTPKLRNIERTGRVSLHFNSDTYGNDVVVMTGNAWVDSDTPPGNEVPAYVAKYADGMQSLGMPPEAFAQAYSVPIRVRPTSLRGH